MLIWGAPLTSAHAQSVPPAVQPVLSALDQSAWDELEEGLSLMRVITPSGLTVSAYRISPRVFELSILTQKSPGGSRARDIGESEGAVIVTNGGFFAINSRSELYPIGYLRLDDTVLSKGWSSAGGTVTFTKEGLVFKPTHEGIPKNEFDVIQSRPMLIEPGSVWSMGSNVGSAKARTILCGLDNGDVILATITRGGLTLFEAGWLMRSKNVGGFFGCDSALALDGGRSTQVWHLGEPQLSHAGSTPVQNFLVVRPVNSADPD